MLKKVVNALNEEAYEALDGIKYVSPDEVEMKFCYEDDCGYVYMELEYCSAEDYLVECRHDDKYFMTTEDVRFLNDVIRSLDNK